MYVYMYVHIYTYVYTHTCKHICTYISMHNVIHCCYYYFEQIYLLDQLNAMGILIKICPLIF